MDIDWSNAPEGADRYYPEDLEMGWSESWGNGNKVWVRLCWFDPTHFGGLHKKRLNSCIMRPINSAQQWTGEGLPPVGAVCECQNDELKWLEGTIVHVGYHGSTKLAVMQAKEEILYGEVGEFRPIKTKEQIAAEERDKAIEDMVALVAKGQDYSVQAETGTSTADYVMNACKQLHDAGYRKQEIN